MRWSDLTNELVRRKCAWNVWVITDGTELFKLLGANNNFFLMQVQKTKTKMLVIFYFCILKSNFGHYFIMQIILKTFPLENNSICCILFYSSNLLPSKLFVSKEIFAEKRWRYHDLYMLPWAFYFSYHVDIDNHDNDASSVFVT